MKLSNIQKINPIGSSFQKFLLLSILPLLASCGSGQVNDYLFGSDSSVDGKGSVSGYVSKGPVSDAACSLYDHSNRKLAGPVNSNNGTFNFPNALPSGFSGIAYVECMGGRYRDEATGNDIALEGIRGGNTVSDGGQIIVTPLTEMAIRKAKPDLSDLSTQAQMVAESFGLDAVDIQNIVPTDVSSKVAADSAADQYGLILASISQLAKEKTVSTSTSVNSVITALEQGLNGNRLNNNTAQAVRTAVDNLRLILFLRC